MGLETNLFVDVIQDVLDCVGMQILACFRQEQQQNRRRDVFVRSVVAKLLHEVKNVLEVGDSKSL